MQNYKYKDSITDINAKIKVEKIIDAMDKETINVMRYVERKQSFKKNVDRLKALAEKLCKIANKGDR